MSVGAQDAFDVIIVGGGPAGLSAAARAEKNKLNYLLLEKGAMANTLDYYYQHGKYVMSNPLTIPLRSDLSFEAGSREQVLEAWSDYVKTNSIKLKTNEPANEINKINGGFQIKTPSSVYTSRNVVLAIGKLGNPRKLGVPGQELEHVSDRLVDPSAYTNKDILVVGGGDSGIEVALSLCENNRVSISHRKSEFFRLNPELLKQVNDKMESKKIRTYFDSNIVRVEDKYAYLVLPDRELRLKTDYIFVKIGAEVPRPFLEKCGVQFSSKDITALPVKDDRYETNVPGLFVVGATGGNDLIKSALNEGYDVIEYIVGNELEPVDEPILRDKLSLIPGEKVDEKLAYISSKVPLITKIQKPLLREFMIQSDIKEFKKDEFVFKEGEYSTTFFTIIEGVVQASFEERPEKEVFFRSGGFFGEMSLLADRRRSSTIKALDDSLLIETPRRTMLKLINSEPSVKRVVDEEYTINTLRSALSVNIFAYEFKEIAPKLEVMSLKKGEAICEEGDVADSFYVISRGSVKISKKTKDGKEYAINYLPAGNYFGEAALIKENSKRSATVSAATSTELIRIFTSDFSAILKHNPELENRLRTEMGRRRIEATSILQAKMEDEEDKGIIASFIKHGVVESTDVLIMDETKCIRCDNCVRACEATHGGQTRLDRRPGPSFMKIHVPIACRHCEGAPCLQDCPPGDAIIRHPDGVVKIDPQKCIGCGNCARFCPYGVIFMVEDKKKPTIIKGISDMIFNAITPKKGKPAPKVKKGIAVKCDLCYNISGGPACVRNCPTGAALRVKPEYFKQVEFL